MRDIANMGLKLLIITVIAALALGVTHSATEGPIMEQRIEAENEARQQALPQAAVFDKIELDPGYKSSDKAQIMEIYQGKDSSNSSVIGYTFKVSSRGFGGPMEFIVGINQAEQCVESVRVMSHEETPGLGAKAADEAFAMQYQGKSIGQPLKVVKGSASEDTDVEAIAGATISSDAVTNGVNEAINYYQQILKGGGEDQ